MNDLIQYSLDNNGTTTSHNGNGTNQNNSNQNRDNNNVQNNQNNNQNPMKQKPKFEIILEDQSDLSNKNKNNIDSKSILQNHRVYQTYTIQQIIYILLNRTPTTAGNSNTTMYIDVDILNEYMLIIDEMILIKSNELCSKLCIDVIDIILTDEIGLKNPQYALPNKLQCIKWGYQHYINILNSNTTTNNNNNIEYSNIILIVFELVLNKHYQLFKNNQLFELSMILPVIEINMNKYQHIQTNILNLYENCIQLNNISNNTNNGNNININNTNSNNTNSNNGNKQLKKPEYMKNQVVPYSLHTNTNISNTNTNTNNSTQPTSTNNIHITNSNTNTNDTQYERLKQLIYSDELNCKHFGIQKIKKILSNQGLIVTNDGSIANNINNANNPNNSNTITSESDAELIGIMLLQCIKNSMIPISSSKLNENLQNIHTKGHLNQFSLTTNVVMSTLCYIYNILLVVPIVLSNISS